MGKAKRGAEKEPLEAAGEAVPPLQIVLSYDAGSDFLDPTKAREALAAAEAEAERPAIEPLGGRSWADFAGGMTPGQLEGVRVFVGTLDDKVTLLKPDQSAAALGAALATVASGILNASVEKAVQAGTLADMLGKSDFAKLVTATCRSGGFSIAHPDTGEACYLVAVSDGGAGKFVLENAKTRKRSKTTSDIRSLLPFRLVYNWTNHLGS